MAYEAKRNAFRKATGNAKATGNNKAATTNTTSEGVESYKVKMPEGSDIKFATIASQIRYLDSGNKSMSINFNRLTELLEAGVLEVNEKGYINGIRVFEPFKG